MSSQQKKNIAAGSLSEEAVAYYLETHPEFFEKHSGLLTSMSLSHVSSGSAVSLIERQVELLRERNRKLERKLTDFIENARMNDLLAEKIHRLGLAMLRAGSLTPCLAAIEASLREDFAADQSILVLVHEDPGLARMADSGRFVRVAAAESAEMRGFDSLFESGKPRCGQLRDTLKSFLFGPGADEIGSTALIPMADEFALGVLAIGSVNSRHFHPGMSTEFLGRLGETLTVALRRYLG